jgi:ribosomal subunit interface protein
MKINVKFNNVDRSDALEEFILKKSKKLEKFLKANDSLNWVISLRDKVFSPVLNLNFHGQPVSIHSKADNAFVAVSTVMDKAKRTLSKKHDLYYHH